MKKIRQVKFRTYIKDAKNGKLTLGIDEERTMELCQVQRYAGKDHPFHPGGTFYSWYLIVSLKWGEMDKNKNPDFILSDETADFYKIL